jgi:hypothetical protein
MTSVYDIIGDIHGDADELVQLLEALTENAVLPGYYKSRILRRLREEAGELLG